MITLKKKFSDSFNFLYNKKALVRIDLNVPISNGKIEDDTRIKKVLPTLFCLQYFIYIIIKYNDDEEWTHIIIIIIMIT